MSSDSSCELNDQGRAFSTILTAFVGSLVNGISNGGVVAFMTGWISWLAVTRVLSGSVITLNQGFKSDDSHTDDAKRTHDVTFLGWVGWLYTAIYSPIVQALWLAENWSKASGALKVIRGMGVSIAALSLTIDTKKRYATALGETVHTETLGYITFILINGLSALGMGIISAMLLIKGAIDVHAPAYAIAPFSVAYAFFTVVWAVISYKVCPVRDGKMKGFGLVVDILCGLFAGIFLAAPAFGLLLASSQPTLGDDDFVYPESGFSSLKDYISCSSVASWQKFVAIFP